MPTLKRGAVQLVSMNESELVVKVEGDPNGSNVSERLIVRNVQRSLGAGGGGTVSVCCDGLCCDGLKNSEIATALQPTVLGATNVAIVERIQPIAGEVK